MTIARDKTSGEVIGQVTWVGLKHGWVTILTKNGYTPVPRSSVRLEELR